MQQFCLVGIGKYFCLIEKKYDQRAKHADTKFCSRGVLQLARYLFLYKLPTPVQVFLANEIKAAHILIKKETSLEVDVKKLDVRSRFLFLKISASFLKCLILQNLFRLEPWSFMWEAFRYKLDKKVTSEYYDRGIDEEIRA